jgi:hypothetical protein
VAAPPSEHPDGGVYAWSVDSADTFADAPEWLITLITSRVHPAGASFDTVNNAEKWRSFINEPVEGNRRGAAIASLYGLLVRHFIDPIVALDIVRMFNLLRCQPPLDDAKVVYIALDIANREADRREGLS